MVKIYAFYSYLKSKREVKLKSFKRGRKIHCGTHSNMIKVTNTLTIAKTNLN